MLCKKCGNELKDTDQFCAVCGEVVNQEPVEQAVAEQAEPVAAFEAAPVPVAKKKGLPKVAIIGAVAVVLVAAVAVMFLAGVFTSDAVKVANAFMKTGEAYSQAMGAFGDVNTQDMEALGINQEYSGEMRFWLVDIPDGAELEGFGVSMAFDYSQSQRHMGMTLTPSYGSVDLLRAQVQIRENEMFLGVPELTGDTYYMIRTDILGQEMSALGADMEGAETMGFNVFDMVAENAAQAEATQAKYEAFFEVLKSVQENVQVKKTGTETIDVNGTELKSDVYHVLVPQQCVTEIMDALEPLYLDASSNASVLDMYRAMGMPEETLAMMEESMGEMDAANAESFAEAKAALEELGDLELDVFINDGYVVAMEFSVTDEDVTVDFKIALGGGENYVDNLSLTAMDQDGEGVVISFVGDHSAAGGAYTDTMTCQVLEAGEYTTEMTWEIRYAPAEQEDNFSFALDAEDVGITMNGQLTFGEQEFVMELDEITMREYGENIGTFALEYRLGVYDPEQVDTSNYMILSEMTEADQQNAMNTISGNAMTWFFWLQENCPELMEMLY